MDHRIARWFVWRIWGDGCSVFGVAVCKMSTDLGLFPLQYAKILFALGRFLRIIEVHARHFALALGAHYPH